MLLQVFFGLHSYTTGLLPSISSSIDLLSMLFLIEQVDFKLSCSLLQDKDAIKMLNLEECLEIAKDDTKGKANCFRSVLST